MLKHLSIRDYALIRQLEVDFDGGFTAITGETGSGKSVVVDALGLALGERGRSSRVRSGSERAEVAAEFELVGAGAAKAWLEERELTDGDDTSLCLLRRTLSADGRSRAFINGRPSALGDLRELAEHLIDVHAQHEHQSLLRPATQRRLLDEFGCKPALLAAVSDSWRTWRALLERAGGAGGQRADLQARLQLLAYQQGELADLAPQPDEFETLFTEQKRLEQADVIIAAVGAASARLSADEDGAISLLAAAHRDTRRLADPALASAVELLDSARINAEEAASELERYAEALERNPERLAEVEARLRQLWDTARRQQCEPQQLAERLDAVGSEIDELETQLRRLDSLDTDIQAARQQWQAAAAELSAVRRTAAPQFAAAIVAEMCALDMPEAQFDVRFDTTESEYGAETVRWLISTNRGAKPGPLGEVASGGELSRISLAIQIVAARNSTVPSLVLDEADVGIGGATADAVGRLLRRLGQHAQILCVTHQPQVAVCAQQHVTVGKRGDAGTDMRLLDDPGRVEEIARMVGGRAVTKKTLAHAADMLAQGR